LKLISMNFSASSVHLSCLWC